MHARKTGALIRAAADARRHRWRRRRRAIVAAVDDYARELGLAFQIVDDVLDVEGSSDALGKTAGKDAAAGKPTYPGALRPRRVAPAGGRVRRRAPRPRSAAPALGGRLAEIAALEPRATTQLRRVDAMPKTRLDQLLVARGLAQSRERARALILAGDVRVDGAPVDQGRHAGRRRRDGRRCAQPDHPWVGRGGSSSRMRSTCFGLDVDRRARRSTSARRPAASPTCCSQRGARARRRARRRTRPARLAAAHRPARRRASKASMRATCSRERSAGRRARVRRRHDRRVVHLAAAHPAGRAAAPGAGRPRRRARQAAVRSRPRRGRRGRHRARPGGARARRRRASRATAHQVGLERARARAVAGRPAPKATASSCCCSRRPTPTAHDHAARARPRSPGTRCPPRSPRWPRPRAWLDARGCHAGHRGATARDAAGLGARWPTVPRETLPATRRRRASRSAATARCSTPPAPSRTRRRDAPLLGVNLGRLGFLTEVGRAELIGALEALLAGRTRIETRLLLDGRVERGGREIVATASRSTTSSSRAARCRG